MPENQESGEISALRWHDWRALFPDPDAADALPYCLRVLLENCLRNRNRGFASDADIRRFVQWRPGRGGFSVPLRVTRVIMPDSSGLPALMDMAALRDAVVRRGGDAASVQPLAPLDLVIDHSVSVDSFGHRGAIDINVRLEFERNAERYRFFKWAQKAFDRITVVPPSTGIIHQVHLERLARVVETERQGDDLLAFPEFVLGGDSHTPMVNGLGVLGWGVGGVEIEAALLGQAYITTVPRVIGVRLVGALSPGVTVTDLVLTVTQRLRAVRVTGDFVEFCGPASASLSVADRATIANMAPEYGATAAFFPIDAATLAYLRQTGRDAAQVDLVERFARAAGFFRTAREPDFDAVVELDLGEVEACVAGPKRPQDRVALRHAGVSFRQALVRPVAAGGYGVAEPGEPQAITVGGARLDGAGGECRALPQHHPRGGHSRDLRCRHRIRQSRQRVPHRAGVRGDRGRRGEHRGPGGAEAVRAYAGGAGAGSHVGGGASGAGLRKEAVLFCKKEPKNFHSFGGSCLRGWAARMKSLLLLFFRKEGLACCALIRALLLGIERRFKAKAGLSCNSYRARAPRRRGFIVSGSATCRCWRCMRAFCRATGPRASCATLRTRRWARCSPRRACRATS